MIELDEQPVQYVATEELKSELERALNSYFGVPRSISHMERRLADNCSSFVLEVLNLVLDDGASPRGSNKTGTGPLSSAHGLEGRPNTKGSVPVLLEPLSILFKNVSQDALQENARRVKPAFLYDPMREIDVYQSFLSPDRMGTATCYGAVVDLEGRRYWLFLEKVTGIELYQVGEFTTWQDVACYLAALHAHFISYEAILNQDRASHLLSYDAASFRRWLPRAREFLHAGEPPRQRQSQALFDRLDRGYEHVVERLAELPRTLIHGEFYPSNILVDRNGPRIRVCPVDWEMAGIGTGLLDLAALTSGRWTDQEKQSLALAYHAALPRDREWRSQEEFLEALDYCRLHLAVQWLGWSPDWMPPPEHRQNWFEEAEILADRLGL
jgi:hypothetical protein